MNATIRKFGYPATLIAEYDHWLVLLRPQAPTLASLVLAARGDWTGYGELPGEAFAEQARVVADIEAVLHKAVDYERINYLMLMMVDPHVHFHVIPRYQGQRQWAGVTYGDAGWPKPPELGSAHALSEAEIGEQAEWLSGLWPSRG